MSRTYLAKLCGKQHVFCKVCRPDVGDKMSVSRMGHPVSQEVRDKIGAVQRILKRGSGNPSWNAEGFAVKGERVFVRLVTGWVRRARAVWVQHNGPIQKGYLIHHHDEDKRNDSIGNLRCWTNGYHTSYHMRGAA